MSYRGLTDFLEELGQAGELVRVEAVVSPRLEAAEITRRVVRSTGSALVFADTGSHEFPLATNLLGTEANLPGVGGEESGRHGRGGWQF